MLSKEEVSFCVFFSIAIQIIILYCSWYFGLEFPYRLVIYTLRFHKLLPCVYFSALQSKLYYFIVLDILGLSFRYQFAIYTFWDAIKGRGFHKLISLRVFFGIAIKIIFLYCSWYFGFEFLLQIGNIHSFHKLLLCMYFSALQYKLYSFIVLDILSLSFQYIFTFWDDIKGRGFHKFLPFAYF
jgi:hypothetical protein